MRQWPVIRPGGGRKAGGENPMPKSASLFVFLTAILAVATPLRAADQKVEASPPPQAAAPSPPVAFAAEVEQLVQAQDVEALRAKGKAVLPILVELYPQYNEAGRANIAWAFYRLGWPSEEARLALMADVHTDDPTLRLQVQWALGRVSNDDSVVDVLLDNLQNDKNPLFREKAACGVASDQIHLTEKQKLRLYERVIALLEAESLETRDLAIRILETQTGQRKNFHADAPWVLRVVAITAWKLWLDDYRENVL
jgi:hypothetical protein